LRPDWLFQGHGEDFSDRDFSISIRDCDIEVEYDQELDGQRARDRVDRYVAALNLTSAFKISAVINASWKTCTDGTKHSYVRIEGSIKPTGRLMVGTVDVTTSASIATPKTYDSRNWSNVTDLARKAGQYPELALALKHYSERVVENNRPLSGIYQALE